MVRKILVIGCLAAGVSQANAEIQSMSSGEMTDTFVKDSTIIVTPAKKPEARREVVTYTISPGEPVKTEEELEAERASQELDNFQAVEEANRAAWEANERFALAPKAEIDFPDLVPREIPFGVQIPEGPFTLPDLLGQTGTESLPYGEELNYNYDGQQYVITIGNVPGFNPVNIDQSYQGNLLKLEPRDTGGFDIILTPPPQ